MDGESMRHDETRIFWGERNTGLETAAMERNQGWVKHLRVGPWSTFGSNLPVMMCQAEIDDLLRRYEGWAASFARNRQSSIPKNLAEQCFSVPSMLVRVDYVWDPVLKACRIFEFDDRPAGIGVTQHLNKVARDAFTRIFESWERAFQKKLAICISEDREGSNDDPVWAAGLTDKPFRVHYGLPSDELREQYIWWPRVSRHESRYYSLTSNSLSTIELEGDKSYGVPMGLWHEIKNVADVPLQQGCVLKPKTGSRFESVYLVKRKSDRDRPGYINAGKAVGLIRDGKVHYWQPLYPPEGRDIHKWLHGDYRLMRRAYIAMTHRPATATGDGGDGICCIGGTWLAGPSDRLHGAENIISGPLLVPKAKNAPSYPWHAL